MSLKIIWLTRTKRKSLKYRNAIDLYPSVAVSLFDALKPSIGGFFRVTCRSLSVCHILIQNVFQSKRMKYVIKIVKNQPPMIKNFFPELSLRLEKISKVLRRGA